VPSYLPTAVLVADADRAFSELLCKHLEAWGCSVFREYDGNAAAQALSSQPVQLAFLCLSLPSVNGLDVARAARASGGRFHAVFLDGCDRPEVRLACLAFGALAYLVKPFAPEQIVPLLNRATRRPPPPSAPENDRRDDLSDLVPGLQVRLSIRAGPATGSYSAQVTEVKPGLSLSAWSGEYSGVYFSLGTPIIVGFATERAWAEFESRVTGLYVRGELTEITLARPGQVIERQRRSAARLPASLPIRAWPADSADPASEMLLGQTEDIGRLGLRAYFDSPLPADRPIIAAIACGDLDASTNLKATLVWYETLGAEPQWHRYGFRFADLDPGMRRYVGALLRHAKTQGYRFGLLARERPEYGGTVPLPFDPNGMS
jgi:CheY-like chemotaxis protein